MRILFALPGLHRVDRGAEIAFVSIANELAKDGNTVTLIGSGEKRPNTPYRFLHASCIGREKFESFPSIPALRNDCAYEELSFAPEFLLRYRPAEYDVTVTCSYPFTNWILRRPAFGKSRPPHVFVTQNGDWPALAKNSEFRLFSCDGLVCTNPDMYERNKSKWRCRTIPNGVDLGRFHISPPSRQELGLPTDRPVVLIVSALIPSKRVELGIEAVSHIPGIYLLLAGDGPLRGVIDSAAEQLLPGRYTRMTVAPELMPKLYQSADAFLHLSRDEPFGNVYLEAMACGLPVAAHDSARTRWIVGDSESLFDTEDPKTVALAVKQALNSRNNRQLRATRAETFSWTRIGGMYQDFLREVVES